MVLKVERRRKRDHELREKLCYYYEDIESNVPTVLNLDCRWPTHNLF